MLVYDKSGKSYKVNHKIDLKEWLEAGYTLENPKEKTTKKSKTEDGE